MSIPPFVTFLIRSIMSNLGAKNLHAASATAIVIQQQFFIRQIFEVASRQRQGVLVAIEQVHRVGADERQCDAEDARAASHVEDGRVWSGVVFGQGRQGYRCRLCSVFICSLSSNDDVLIVNSVCVILSNKANIELIYSGDLPNEPRWDTALIRPWVLQTIDEATMTDAIRGA